MKSIFFATGSLSSLGLLLLMSVATGARAGGADGNPTGDTTIVRDANGVATITQSGDPEHAAVHVERTPGRTTIYRQSGGNTAIVTMGTSPPGDHVQDIPEWARKLFEH